VKNPFEMLAAGDYITAGEARKLMGNFPSSLRMI